jgi:hypothetical protein
MVCQAWCDAMKASYASVEIISLYIRGEIARIGIA